MSRLLIESADQLRDTEFSPEPQTSGSGIKPPTRRIGSGMFDSNGGEPPAGTGSRGSQQPEASGVTLFSAIYKELDREIHDPSSDPFLLKHLDETMAQYGLDSVGVTIRQSRVDQFMSRAKESGLIRKFRSISLGQYIAAMPSFRDVVRWFKGK